MRSLRASFTLIELLVVIAVVAILAIVVILTLNPSQLLKQSRDSSRLSEMNALNSAISLYAADLGTSVLGTANTVYISIPDSSPTCANLGLPALPNSWSYACASASTYRNVDGSGWIPLNFQGTSFRSPLNVLPIDSTNSTSTRSYYSYTPSGNKYELSAVMESTKFASQQTSDGGMDPASYETGSDLTVTPFAHGLVGYWSFEEGSGTNVADSSGYLNAGTWSGAGIHYATGKAGSYAGQFASSTSDFVNVPDSTSTKVLTSAVTVLAWINPGTLNSSCTASGNAIAIKGSSSVSFNYGMSLSNTTLCTWYNNTNGTFAATISSGTWQFVAVTQTTSAAQYFYNGDLIGQTSNAYVMTNTAQPLRIGSGASSGAADRFFSGLIDDVRVYNRVLSSGEIQALYNATR
jgi:prepilin-type N-terminal cleavage/methylation domain-containing protein